MKVQLKTMAVLLLATVLAFGSGCTKDPENGGDNNGTENGGSNGGGNGGGNNGGNSGGGAEEGMYLGIIGFNDALTTKSISLLNTSTEYGFTNFISNLTMRDGTALYHADNTALDWLQSATLPSDLINVSLVTFTDGLDNGSLILNNNYGSQAEFLNAVNNRILNDRVGGKNIDAYAIGMKGNDVQDYTTFQQNLRKLSSDPNYNVFEVEDWDEVKQRFREIAIQLYNETTTVSTNVKIPGGKDNGTVIRITFDNVSNGNNSTQYIQGTYTYENGKGKLSNINYYGLQSSSGSTVVSDRQDGICFWYTFAELQTPDGNAVNNTDHMNLWYYNSNTTSWQHETEFTPSSYSNVSVERKSAVTVLVLDCTTSLGDDFEKMKEAAIEFVEVLDHYGENGGGENGGGGNEGNDNSLVASDFEWFRQGSAFGTGLAEYGLEWRMNAKDVYARIYPMEGVTLFMFDPRVWNATTTESEKIYLFQNTPYNSALSVYNNVSVSYNSTYDDVIGTIMPDGTYHLLHVTKLEIGEFSPQGIPYTITGQAK